MFLFKHINVLKSSNIILLIRYQIREELIWRWYFNSIRRYFSSKRYIFEESFFKWEEFRKCLTVVDFNLDPWRTRYAKLSGFIAHFWRGIFASSFAIWKESQKRNTTILFFKIWLQEEHQVKFWKTWFKRLIKSLLVLFCFVLLYVNLFNLIFKMLNTYWLWLGRTKLLGLVEMICLKQL